MDKQACLNFFFSFVDSVEYLVHKFRLGAVVYENK